MDASATAALFGSPRQGGDAALTPDLQQSRYMSGESDDDSAHSTPTDMTVAIQASPRESWPLTKMRTAEDEVRKIHYIESPAQNSPITAIPAVSAAPIERRTLATTLLAAAPGPGEASTAVAPSQQSSILASTTPAATTMPPSSTVITASEIPIASASTSALPSSSAINLNPAHASASGLPPATASNDNPTTHAPDAAKAAAAEPVAESVDPLASRLVSTAPSSAASTPASTPGAAPQTYARKRGRPRKHPLPDPNMPPKTKRKLSADNAATAAKKKANAAAAARSAASTSGSLLSVPDLGRLIPQGSSSENAQNFIQNNLRLFADLFVALQKQASTDHSVRDEANAQLKDISQVTVDQPLSATQASADDSAPDASAAVISGAVGSSVTAVPSSSQTDPVSDALASNSKVSGPSDGIRDEIKKKMADVAKGREAIQAEMLQMRVDASFFENAQKTVDERIVILRERIAKHTALLQREREATRKVREATRMAKKDRKVREKGLRASEREERRLAQTFLQLEREIAAEEEERRRLEEAESSEEEDGSAMDDEPATSALGQSNAPSLDHLDEFNPTVLDATPSDASSMSATATPSVTNDTPAAADRAIGFSDEELAKVLGISTSELAGFSQTLELTSLQAPSASLSSADTDTAAQMAQATFASLLAPTQSDDAPVSGGSGAAADSFDVAAFLEMASSFGAVTSSAPPAEQQDASA